ncbi:MAG: CDP-alcohol phosphatidyltransferase family protein [Candidatus Methanomethylophilaceae archaeon]
MTWYRNLAHTVTGCRIACSALILFTQAFSPAFFVLYLTAGLSDMIDGPIARRTGTACEFGSRLDTFADICLVAACMIVILPTVAIPTFLWIWILLILAVKCTSMTLYFIRRRGLAAEHTALNRITGIMLFVLPITMPALDVIYSGTIVCVAATCAAVQELLLVWRKSIDTCPSSS